MYTGFAHDLKNLEAEYSYEIVYKWRQNGAKSQGCQDITRLWIKKKKKNQDMAQMLPGTAQSYAGLMLSVAPGEEPGGATLTAWVACSLYHALLQNKTLNVIFTFHFFFS